MISLSRTNIVFLNPANDWVGLHLIVSQHLKASVDPACFHVDLLHGFRDENRDTLEMRSAGVEEEPDFVRDILVLRIIPQRCLWHYP